ncbi:MAG: SPOR domain-containing protein [Desulfonatronovibrio sp.]
MATKNKKKSTQKSTGKFKIELGFTKTLSLGAFVVLAMVWAFILGVFVGRGYNPEDVVPEISRVMPDAGQSISVPKVLRPEELEFFDRLKSSPEQPQAGSQKQTLARTKLQPDIETPPKKPLDPAEVETFVYSYQVGSFQTIEKATKTQEQLARDGFSASIAQAFVNNEPWYRVIVEFESTDQNSEKMIQKLEDHGISQPLLRGRRPS